MAGTPASPGTRQSRCQCLLRFGVMRLNQARWAVLGATSVLSPAQGTWGGLVEECSARQRGHPSSWVPEEGLGQGPCPQGARRCPCPRAGRSDLVPRYVVRGLVPRQANVILFPGRQEMSQVEGTPVPKEAKVSVFLSRQRASCPQGARRFPYPQESIPCPQGDAHVPELAEMLLSPGRGKWSGPQGSRGCPCSQAGWQ